MIFRKIFFLLVLFSFSFISIAKEVNYRKIEIAREELMLEYNFLQALDQENWELMFSTFYEELYESGYFTAAEELLILADYSLKQDILKIYKNKIDQLSENGLVVILFPITMYILYFEGDEKSKMVAKILFFATLGDDDPASEI